MKPARGKGEITPNVTGSVAAVCRWHRQETTIALFLLLHCCDVGSGNVCGADETCGVTTPRWLILHSLGL